MASPGFSGIAHVELSVRDLETSVAWYTAVFGLRDVWRGTNEGEGITTACALLEPETRVIIALTQHMRILEPAFSPRRVGLDHLSFAVVGREAMEAWLAHLDAIGVVHSDIQEEPPLPAAITFRDPDGIALELVQRNLRPAVA